MNVNTCGQSTSSTNCCDPCQAIGSLSVVAGTIVAGTLGGTVSNIPFNVVNPENGNMESINTVINEISTSSKDNSDPIKVVESIENNATALENLGEAIATNDDAMNDLVDAIVNNPVLLSKLSIAMLSPDTNNSIVLDSLNRFYENDGTSPTT